MSRYADGTSVSVEKTKAEIEKVLMRYGADQYLTGWDNEGSAAFVMFRAHGKSIKFRLPLPNRDDNEFKWTPSRKWTRTPDDQVKAWEQACREKWRALYIVIKAKLEAVESGITIFEDEFLANIVLPSGETAGEWLRPQIELAYGNGRMPKSLLALPSPPSET